MQIIGNTLPKRHLKRYLLIALAMSIGGTKYPEHSEKQSINKQNFSLNVLPEDSVLVFSKIISLDTFKHVDNRNDYLISNDGKNIVIIAWQYVQIKYAQENGNKTLRYIGPTAFGPDWGVKIINVKSKREKFIPYSRLCSQPKKATGPGSPVGDFWYVWRNDVHLNGDSLSIVLPDGRTKKIDIKSEMSDHP